MLGFGLLEKLMGSVTGAITDRQRHDLYNQAQLEAFAFYDQEEISLSESSTSSSAWRSKPVKSKIKAKVIKDEFFKKEEFDVN